MDAAPVLCPFFDGKLPVSILVKNILPFIPYKCTFLKVANTSKGMIGMRLVLSVACSISHMLHVYRGIV